MAARPLPDPELLRKLLRYDPETGKLYWLPRTPDMFNPGRRGRDANCKRWNKHFAEKEAFGICPLGYCRGRLFNQYVLAHRVVWALSYGYWPRALIDHINGDRADNRLSNLREATYSDNVCNSARSKRNSSGYKGVFACSQPGKWRARICKNGKSVNLGSFRSAKEAHAAYAAASDRYHGDFGRTA